MKTCGVCGKKYRSGGGLVFHGPSMDRVRACLDCEKKAVRIVPLASGATKCSTTGCENFACYCFDCLRKHEHKAKVDRDIKEVAKQLRKRAEAYETSVDEFAQGILDGLESAAKFIESGKW